MKKPLYECETEAEVVEAMQELINSGMAWKLEGSIGRQAMAMLESGQCELGRVAHVDYWGNRVPSRFEVRPGTKGAPLATRKEAAK